MRVKTNTPTSGALRQAIRAVLDEPKYRSRASSMAEEFGKIDTRSEILRIFERFRASGEREGPRSQAIIGQVMDEPPSGHIIKHHITGRGRRDVSRRIPGFDILTRRARNSLVFSR